MTSDRPTGAPTQQNRRWFFRLGWMGAVMVVLGGQCWLLFKLLFTPQQPEEPDRHIVAGPVEQFDLGSVTHFWKHGFLLVRHAAGFRALSHQCTHQRCKVDYLATRGVIHCPCHGSEFDLTGAVLTGPAPRSLEQFPATIRHGQVMVDTAQRL